MRILDIDYNEIFNPDLTRGYLREETFVAFEIAQRVLDGEIDAPEPEDFEPILRYYEYSQEELEQQERDAILSLILDSVEVDAKPADKLGFDTVQRYDHGTNRVFWEFVPNGESGEDGSYLHPFGYTQGMSVRQGMWYTDGSDIWEAIADGVPSGFDDAEFFDIIAI